MVTQWAMWRVKRHAGGTFSDREGKRVVETLRLKFLGFTLGDV